MDTVRIQAPDHPVKGHIRLPGSKSISNRALVIRALSKQTFAIHNLSTGDDTTRLDALLNEGGDFYNAGHGGTTFRFLTAYLAIRDGRQILSGSARMMERPIRPLIEALNSIGADIVPSEEGQHGSLVIGPFKEQKSKEVVIDGGVSSQFISALCLVAPYLPDGLVIHIKNPLVSRPYLLMTLQMMAQFGVQSIYDKAAGRIKIEPAMYRGTDYTVESDWSGAGYFYSIASFSPGSEIELSLLTPESMQSDSIMAEMATDFGVTTGVIENGIVIRGNKEMNREYQVYNFMECPDLAQTVAFMAAGHGKSVRLDGLSTLRQKETDRIAALGTELEKSGVMCKEQEPDSILISGEARPFDGVIDTYRDHRMALASAPLAWRFPLEIADPGVVTKSYPGYWDELSLLGCTITYR